MVRVPKYELTVEVYQLLGGHGLEGPLSSYGHEHRSVDGMVRETHLGDSCFRDRALGEDFECQGTSTHVRLSLCHIFLKSIPRPRVYGHAQLWTVMATTWANRVDGLYLESRDG